MIEKKVFHLHEDDNVAVAMEDLSGGEVFYHADKVRSESVPRGHKVSIMQIGKGECIFKFGQVIGEATQEIQVGEHVHVHNLTMVGHQQDYGFSSMVKETQFVEASLRDSFMGYRRADGKVGTRNYVGIISSVNCSATVA